MVKIADNVTSLHLRPHIINSIKLINCFLFALCSPDKLAETDPDTVLACHVDPALLPKFRKGHGLHYCPSIIEMLIHMAAQKRSPVERQGVFGRDALLKICIVVVQFQVRPL